MDAGPWNWLEVAKLLASLVVPLTLALFGVFVHRVTKRFEHIQWRSQKLVEKRLAIYDDLVPQFNDLLCYFTFVGNWRDVDPPDVVAMKRNVDKKIYLASPLFSHDFFVACQNFQQLCFATYNGWGRDALLRTQLDRRKQSRSNDWIEAWDSCFSENAVEPKVVREAYDAILAVMSREIGVHDAMVTHRTGQRTRESH